MIGQLTEAEIENLKKQYPRGLFALTADGHIAYFSTPDRKAMNAAMSATTPDAPLAYFESMMADTFVGGSKAILEEDDLFAAAVTVFKDVIETKQATLVKL